MDRDDWRQPTEFETIGNANKPFSLRVPALVVTRGKNGRINLMLSMWFTPMGLTPSSFLVAVDRKTKTIRDAAGVREKFGVDPAVIPDYLALVGDAQDGYPGIAGIGAVGAARLLNRYGPIERFPPAVLGERLDQALLFKQLATLRRDAPLFDDVEQLLWRGPTERFAEWTQRLGAPKLLDRCLAASPR